MIRYKGKIRPAAHSDLDHLVAMGKKFHAMSEQPTPYDPASFREMMATMLLMQDGTVFVSGEGMIGGVLLPSWVAPAWTIATELFWYAEDVRGVDLLIAFEEWAADKGANEIRMTTLGANPRAGTLLRRRGYAASEISYAKVI